MKVLLQKDDLLEELSIIIGHILNLQCITLYIIIAILKNYMYNNHNQIYQGNLQMYNLRNKNDPLRTFISSLILGSYKKYIVLHGTMTSMRFHRYRKGLYKYELFTINFNIFSPNFRFSFSYKLQKQIFWKKNPFSFFLII